MKKVTILFPDMIYRTLGTSRSAITDLTDFTPENLIKVLCEDSNYHDRYKFRPEDVRILSVWELTDKLFQEKIITGKEQEIIKIW